MINGEINPGSLDLISEYTERQVKVRNWKHQRWTLLLTFKDKTDMAVYRHKEINSASKLSKLETGFLLVSIRECSLASVWS